MNHSRWVRVVDALRQAMEEKKTNYGYITFGKNVVVPRIASEAASERSSPDNLNGIPVQKVYYRNLGASAYTPSVPSKIASEDPDLIPDSAIAVIGMACEYPRCRHNRGILVI
jgi:hypothetical protein